MADDSIAHPMAVSMSRSTLCRAGEVEPTAASSGARLLPAGTQKSASWDGGPRAAGTMSRAVRALVTITHGIEAAHLDLSECQGALPLDHCSRPGVPEWAEQDGDPEQSQEGRSEAPNQKGIRDAHTAGRTSPGGEGMRADVSRRRQRLRYPSYPSGTSVKIAPFPSAEAVPPKPSPEVTKPNLSKREDDAHPARQ